MKNTTLDSVRPWDRTKSKFSSFNAKSGSPIQNRSDRSVGGWASSGSRDRQGVIAEIRRAEVPEGGNPKDVVEVTGSGLNPGRREPKTLRERGTGKRLKNNNKELTN